MVFPGLANSCGAWLLPVAESSTTEMYVMITPYFRVLPMWLLKDNSGCYPTDYVALPAQAFINANSPTKGG